MSDLLTIAIYALAALFGAVLLLTGAGIVVHWGHRRERGLLPFVFYGVILTAGLGTVLSGRNLFLPADFISGGIEGKHMLVVWVQRFTSIFMLIVSFERIMARVLAHGKKQPFPKPLLIGFCTLYVSNLVLPALFGAHRGLSHEYIYPLVTGCAALLVVASEARSITSVLRNALFVFLLVGVVLVPIRPELVLSKDYEGFIPGLSLRFAGIAPGPNALGPLCAVFMFCLLDAPFKSKFINFIAWPVAVLSFVLAQSKSSWIAFLISLSVILFYRYREGLKSLWNGKNTVVAIASIYGVLIGACAVFVLVMFSDIGDKLSGFLHSRAGADLMSLTGRDQIWAIALYEWKQHPIFGYGLSIWDVEFRIKIGLPAALHAHNQLYQSLCSAGTVGAAGLLVYVALLFRYAVSTARASKGLTLAVFALIIVRAISEVPFSLTGFGTEQLMHVLLLMLIAAYHVPSRARHAGYPMRLHSTHPYGA